MIIWSQKFDTTLTQLDFKDATNAAAVGWNIVHSVQNIAWCSTSRLKLGLLQKIHNYMLTTLNITAVMHN